MEMEGLYQCAANYVPLSPISFLKRAAFVYEQNISVIYDNITYTWKETYESCIRLASALSLLGIKRHDVVAALAPNIPALYELHFGVPMAGAVLSALNTRLDPSTLAMKLELLEAKFVFVDYQHVETVLDALKMLSKGVSHLPRLVVIFGNVKSVTERLPQDSLDYNVLLSMGNSEFNIIHPNDEHEPISVNFTSGSTGEPKGVVYSHRAAYLNSLATIFRYDMPKMPVFLWTPDMFRYNGWCFPWAIASLGGTNVCFREASAKAIFDSIVTHKVTHLFAPPNILDMIANSKPSDQRAIRKKVDIIVTGRTPLQILSKIKKLGFCINLAYGMTEALGPMTVTSLKTCNDDGSSLDDDDDKKLAEIKSREGIHNLLMEDFDVKNPKTMASVPHDGKTIGEVMFRGNTIMSGYLKNIEGTKNVFEGGWYRTGDLATRTRDGYIQMKDRALDGIRIGGEIISMLEVERVIRSHPTVKDVAVVGMPDDVLGEMPCAFVMLKDGCFVSSEEIVNFCEQKSLSRHMIPRTVYFGGLPVNCSGKILKFCLREKVKPIGNLPYTNGH